MGGAQRVLEGILEKTKGLVHGVTCGAGMPFKLGEIASKFDIFYYPIVSSARAFKILFLELIKAFYQNLVLSFMRIHGWLGGIMDYLIVKIQKNQKNHSKE